MRRLLIAVWGLSLAALCGIYGSFDMLADSYAVRLQSPPADELQNYIKQLNDQEEEAAAYALTRSDELQMGEHLIHGVVVCEYFRLDRAGMGITLISGRYPKSGELKEAIISDRTAQALHPSMECIGEEMVVRGKKYRIVGVYSQSRIAGITPVRMDVMLPAGQEGEYESVFLWMTAKDQAGGMLRTLEGLSSPDGYPGTEVIDLHSCALVEKQWIACVMVFMVCICAGCLWMQARRQRKEMPRGTGDSFYTVSAGKWFRGRIADILADWKAIIAMAVLCGAAVWLIKTLYLPPDSLPDNLLSPIAWYDMLIEKAERALVQNTFYIPSVQQLILMKKAGAIFKIMAVMSGAGYVLVSKCELMPENGEFHICKRTRHIK